MPRTTNKKIDKKIKKTKSRRAVPLAVREARLDMSPGPGNGSNAKFNGSVARPTASSALSTPSPSSERDGVHVYDMMFRWSPLPVILRQQALATSMFLSLTQIWSPK